MLLKRAAPIVSAFLASSFPQSTVEALGPWSIRQRGQLRQEPQQHIDQRWRFLKNYHRRCESTFYNNYNSRCSSRFVSSPCALLLASVSSSSSSSSPSRDFWKTHEEIIAMQSYVSAAAATGGAASGGGNSSSISSSTVTTTDEHEFLGHQARTFDQMASYFAERRTIPDNLVPIYQILAEKILSSLERERGRVQLHSNTNYSGDQEDSDAATQIPPPLYLLDVACGTGALWPFLLEQATKRGLTLHIQGVDLSPEMVKFGQQHAQTLLAQQGQSKHEIRVTVSGVLDFPNSDKTDAMPNQYWHAIVCNACWGNFYNPEKVLAHLTGLLQSHSSARKGPFGILYVTHPLGAGFVQELRDSDPRTVPHLLPQKWNLIGLPLQMEEFLQTIQNIANPPTEVPFYYAALRKVRHSLLSWVWRFRGPVARGYGRGGKKLGFPTANLVVSQVFRHALQEMDTGVYIGWARMEGEEGGDDPRRRPNNNNNNNSNPISASSQIHKAVINVGYSPTFEGQENAEKIIEAHFILPVNTRSPLPDFYGQTMRLELLAYLRPEQKFASFPDLIAQISADVQDASDALDSDPVLAQAPITDSEFFYLPTTTQDKECSWERLPMHEYLLRDKTLQPKQEQ